MEPNTEQKKLVLLIEDDQSIRELYATALIKAGIEIAMAEDGAQGLEMALAKKPDVIMVDIDMPVMNGHEFTNKLRLDPWGRNAKIIFLTNHSDATNLAHAVMQKPEEYIVKANEPIKDVINKVRIAMHT